MKINKETIDKIAHLSRLHVDPKEEAALINSLNDIIDWVDKLQKIDTEGVTPLTHMSFEENVWREDRVSDVLPREQGLQNAPRQDGEFFRVPKVID